MRTARQLLQSEISFHKDFIVCGAEEQRRKNLLVESRISSNKNTGRVDTNRFICYNIIT